MFDTDSCSSTCSYSVRGRESISPGLYVHPPGKWTPQRQNSYALFSVVSFRPLPNGKLQSALGLGNQRRRDCGGKFSYWSKRNRLSSLVLALRASRSSRRFLSHGQEKYFYGTGAPLHNVERSKEEPRDAHPLRRRGSKPLLSSSRRNGLWRRSDTSTDHRHWT